MSLHFPQHTQKHTVPGSFLQKSAHWTNPLALAAGREKQKWTSLADPKLSSLSNHLSKHPPALSLQCCDERERGQDKVKVWREVMRRDWEGRKESGCRKGEGRRKKAMRGKSAKFCFTCNGLFIYQFLHMRTKEHGDRKRWKIKAGEEAQEMLR